MSDAIFKRYEKKYMLTRQQCAQLTEDFANRLRPDRYGSYTISNIYYDTDNFDLIRMSIEKPVYKEKLRLRSYGAQNESAPVFAEIKKKYAGVVYKRREKLSQEEARRFLVSGTQSFEQTQIMKEIAYLLKIYPIKPKVFLSYDRVALAGVQDEGLRVTFDSAVRFRQTELNFCKGSWGTEVLNPDNILMEIKIPGAFPLWLSRNLSERGIFSTSFSKYGACYSAHLVNNFHIREVSRGA